MGIGEAFKGLVGDELIEIIEWIDERRDLLAWKFPDRDREIKRGAQLIVRESQAAQFILLGEYADLFGPGLHRLDTPNIPLITTLKGWKYGFASPFKADVWFLATRLFSGVTWGTQHPIPLRDADFGMVRVRAFGTCDVRVTDPAVFLRNVVGTNPIFMLDEFTTTMRPRIVGLFTETLAKASVPILDAATRYTELGVALQPTMSDIFKAAYGLSLEAFTIENLSVPAELEHAIDQRGSMAAIGNLDNYVKLQLARSFTQPGSDGGGMAKMGAELAAGMALGQTLVSGLTPKKKDTDGD